ncbi:DUF6691 family protein [Ascidiimonas aurantiaca]|uniref:DUF6691 family protein n=1 Tax=Ascidiimonas aurantiaca TaxID=1685432 RepID=UPI0030ECF3DF
MKSIGYLSIGVFFGIVLFKSEAASWFRIFEMFQFKSFHMYGIIGSALLVGTMMVQLIKRLGITSFFGKPIVFIPKQKDYTANLAGGIIFGLGWALAGACPGPMFVLLGSGYVSLLLVILAAMLGTFVYGLLKDKLPH